MAQRCKAIRCPDDGLPDDVVFCSHHWDLLAAEAAGFQEWLCDSYGTETWCDVLAFCVAELRVIEARLGTPW